MALDIEAAEATWDSIVTGYSTRVPRALRSQLSSLDVVVVMEAIDGAGGAVATAQNLSLVSIGDPGAGFPPGFPSNNGATTRPWALPTTAIVRVDPADIDFLIGQNQLLTTVIHEVGHALGFAGNFFDLNDLAETNPLTGLTEYTGQYGVAEYRASPRANPFGNPLLESGGGAGTAGSHWEDGDPAFFDTVGMVSAVLNGFVPPPGFTSEIHPATIGVLRDLGYVVEGIAGDDTIGDTGGGGFPTKTGRPPPQALTAVPEPGSAMILFGLSVFGLGLRCRQEG